MKLIIDIPENTYEQIKGLVLPDNATVCDIEQIRAEIQKEADNRATPYGMKIYYRCLSIIDKYTKGE